MRVLHLTSHLNAGGVTSSVLTVASRLRARGHTVAIASDDGALKERVSESGCAWWRMPLATSAEFSPRLWRARSLLFKRLKEERMDVMHAHTRVAQVLAASLSRKIGIPYVTTWHGFFRPNLGRRLWPCTGLRTIAISEPVRDHLMRDFGMQQDRIRVIPHGIDADLFRPTTDAASIARLRAGFGLTGQGLVVGTITRLIRSRQIDQLIRTWPKVAQAFPRAQLLIVGDGEDRSRLVDLAKTLTDAHSIKFVPAVSVTREALSVIDVFAFLPADKEGFGLILLEAMAAGRAIVSVKRGGGSSWLLEESKVGRLVAPDDPDALSAMLIALLSDSKSREILGQAAEALVRERYAVERMMDAIESVYGEVVQTREAAQK